MINFETLHRTSCPNVIFRAIWGSHAFGLSTPQSDRDQMGVFVLPATDYLSLLTPPEQCSDAQNDIRYYALQNYLKMAAQANPNILDSLFLPEDCILKSSTYWEEIRQNRHLFISQTAVKTYGEYARAQIKKARGCNKRISNPQPIEPPLKEMFCRIILPHSSGFPGRPIPLTESKINLAHCHVAAVEYTTDMYRLYTYGPDAKGVFRNGMLVCESIPIEDETTRFAGYLIYNRTAYEQAKIKHKQYWEWKATRNENRWISQESGALDYDAKNMMHTIRLLYSCLNILQHGEPCVRFSGAWQADLMKIRQGVFSYEEILSKTENLFEKIQAEIPHTSVKETVDLKFVNELLLSVTQQWSRDHV